MAPRAYPVGHAGQARHQACLRCTGHVGPFHAQALLEFLHQRSALRLPGTAAKHLGIGLLAAQLGRKPVVLPHDVWNPCRCAQCLGRRQTDACMATPALFKFVGNGLLWNVLHATAAVAAQLFHKAGADLANVMAGGGKGGIGWKQRTLQRGWVERYQALCHRTDDVAVLGHAAPGQGFTLQGQPGFGWTLCERYGCRERDVRVGTMGATKRFSAPHFVLSPFIFLGIYGAYRYVGMWVGLHREGIDQVLTIKADVLRLFQYLWAHLVTERF